MSDEAPMNPITAALAMMSGAGPLDLLAMALRDNRETQEWLLGHAARLLVKECGYYNVNTGGDGNWTATHADIGTMRADDVARVLVAGALRAMGVECLI